MPRRRREIPFTDLCLEPDSIAVSPRRPDWLFLDGSVARDHWLARGSAYCPRCDDSGPPDGKEYCSACDCCGADYAIADGSLELPGLPVGYAEVPDWDSGESDSGWTPVDPSKLLKSSDVGGAEGLILLPDGSKLPKSKPLRGQLGSRRSP